MSMSSFCSLSRRAIRATPGFLSLGLAASLMTVPTLVVPGSASAQVTAGQSKHLKSTKTAGRYRETGRYRGSTAQRSLDAHRKRHQNRQLRSPVGSPINTSPDVYLQLGGATGHPTVYAPPVHHPGHYYPQPYVVYINEDAVEPPGYGAPGAAQQQLSPQPIYIVNQQPAPQVIQLPPEAAPAPEPAYTQPAPAPAPRQPRSTEPQALTLSVVPSDAQIYLDDELLGEAGSVAASLTSLEPGIYVLEVVHSSYSPQRLVFGVSTDPVSITIDLTADRPSRRARVK